MDIHIVDCPLLNDKNDLRGRDRHCHIPATRTFYLNQNQNQECHDGKGCLACPAFQKMAKEEVSLRESLEKEKAKQNRKRQTQNRIESARLSNCQPAAGA